MAMTRKFKEQILTIRDRGRTNMFDVHMVQRLAFDQGFYELVNFIEEDRKAYVHFIMTGKAPWADGEEPDDAEDGP